MLRRSHLFLGITSTFGKEMSLAQGNNTPTWPRIELGSPDPESDALTTRPVRPLLIKVKLQINKILFGTECLVQGLVMLTP